MKLALVIALASAALSVSQATAEETIIEGVKLSRDFDCDGQDVVVAGQGNAIKLLGACGAVRVIGADHRIEFEKAKSLEVMGVKISVAGGTVAALALDVSENTVKAVVQSSDGPAEVRIFGADQKSVLRFASPAKVTVGGSANELVYGMEDGVKSPSISALGVDLRIKKAK